VLRYGVVERITRPDSDEHVRDGRRSKRRAYRTRIVEKPGVSPAILFHLIGNTIFLRLSDVADGLPPYKEGVHLLALDRTESRDDPVAALRAAGVTRSTSGHICPSGPLPALSQAACYQRLSSELRQAVQAALRSGSKHLLGTYLQALLAYPDSCTRAETVVDTTTGRVLAHAPALPADRLYPKEQALVEWVRRERARSRRVLCYVVHSDVRDLTPRLQDVLEREGFLVAVLKASTVPPERREEWIARRAAEGADVLLTNPRLVQTGLDLIEWPTVLWYEPEFSVYVMRQASRRSWRPGQWLPVEVPFLAYTDTMQAQALALVAAKMRSALVVEGELPEDGLAALEGDDRDTLVALARALAAEPGPVAVASDAPSLEALFDAARSHEADGDSYLIAGTWERDVAGAEPREFGSPVAANLPGARPTAPPVAMPPDATVSQLVLALESGSKTPCTGDAIAADGARGMGGRVISFEKLAELARVVQRPRRRTRRVPEGQLSLLSA
jgi:hypothetical protein